jgi:hypothetical protein
MRKTLGTFYETITSKSDSKRFLDSEIELVSDETAQEVRGGDKDYTPMYDDEVERYSKWFSPSVLLSL